MTNKHSFAWRQSSSYLKLSSLLSIITILITYRRLFYGIDFTDEAFYLAIPYNFTLGAKLFIDEINLRQMSTFVLYPFIKFYYLFMESKGIVLFTRHLYFFFMLFTAIIVYKAIKNFLDKDASLVISLTSLAFIYFNIPNLGYNTLGIGFFLAGCFLGIPAVLKERSPTFLFWAGLCHGLASIAYPTMFVASTFYALIVALLMQRKKLLSTISYCLGALTAAIPIMILIFLAGVDVFLFDLKFTNSIGVPGGGISKILSLIGFFGNWFFYKVIFAVFLLLILVISKFKRNLAGYVLLFLPLAPLFFYRFGFYAFLSSAGYIFYYSLLAPYLLLFISQQKPARHLFYGVWVPSFIAGMLTGYTSNNGYIASVIGLVPGSIVTSIFLVMTLSGIFLKGKLPGFLNRKLLLLPPVIVIAILLVFQYGSVYRDDNIMKLNTKVKDGPYWGLYTTKEKNDYLANLSEDIALLAKPHDKVFYYDNFPAGYLLTSLRPAGNTCWIVPPSRFPGVNRRVTVDYFKENKYKSSPDLAIRIENLFYTSLEKEKFQYSPSDPINNFIESEEYEVVLARKDYTIFRKVK